MPAAVAARIDVDPLDADVGRIFSLELDPVAVNLDIVGDVRGDEILGVKANTWRPESDGRRGCERSGAECKNDELLHHGPPLSRARARFCGCSAPPLQCSSTSTMRS